MGKSALPFVGLGRPEWQNLLDAALLSAWLVVLVAMGYATLRFYGQDFRGYYAAARVLRQGGDPYAYSQVAPVLVELTGRAGNNPYYYPPWFAVVLTPLAAFLPYEPARAVWTALNLVFLWVALRLTLAVIGWEAQGWRRWLTYLSAAYLLAWLCLRFEQTGILIFLFLSLALWAIQRGSWGLTGLSLALLMTKPQASFVVFGVLLVALWFSRKRAIVWCLVSLTLLVVVSTWILPGWYQHFFEPGFGKGLTHVLDGPDKIVAKRINTTMLHWLDSMGIPGILAWAIYALTVVGCGWLLVRALCRSLALQRLTALATTVGFLVTPYALQYDYPPLILPLLAVYKELPHLTQWRRWMGLGILAFLFTVPLWEGPISDGFWLPVGTLCLLLL
ncbi:MAG: glycosyltransferase family 87 protein, partial [Anaerolineae bacterium]